jgi:hypothetical protein
VAYARRTRDCGWYIYWTNTEAEQEALKVKGKTAARDLAHLTVQGPFRNMSATSGRDLFTYPEVREMLKSNNFEAIENYVPDDQHILIRALSEFISDVEREYGAPSKALERTRDR